MVTKFGQLPDTNVVPISLILSGLVFAGAGGVNNLAQSNWIRDKGFGMGIYIPRIVSPITGEEAAAPATGSMVRQDAENIRRFHGWWTVANKEQLVSFWFICIFSITVFSTLAYSTVLGQNISSGQANLAFIKAEGEALKTIVAPWFGTFFWVFGALSLILVALGVIDYISRIVADVHQDGVPADRASGGPRAGSTSSSPGARSPPGSAILLSGFNQPLLLLVDRRLPQRDGDVRLLDPAHPAQSARAAAGAARARAAPGDAGVRDAVLRLLRGLAGARPGAGDTWRGAEDAVSGVNRASGSIHYSRTLPNA